MYTLLSVLFLSAGSLGVEEDDKLSSFLESPTHHATQDSFPQFSQKVVCLGLGTTLGLTSLWAKLGWGICQMTPWSSTVGNECLLTSRLCSCVAYHAFSQLFSKTKAPVAIDLSSIKSIPASQSSWYRNRALLSQIPALSDEERHLLQFLECRWLSKSSGFISMMIDRICPLFGVSLQVHPATTHAYARDLWHHLSHSYKMRVEEWKQTLPHPHNFPLILTRPAQPIDLRAHLPSCLTISSKQNALSIVKDASAKVETTQSKVIVDLTDLFAHDGSEQVPWLQTWQSLQRELLKACDIYKLAPTQILCMQRLRQEGIGGIRLLPLATLSMREVEEQHRSLLELVALFGLAANQVELDRYPLLPVATSQKQSEPVPIKFEEFISDLNNFEQNWKSRHPQKTFPQKTLMVQATLQTLRGLFANLADLKWEQIKNCPTRSSVVQLALSQISDQFKILTEQGEEARFFDTTSHLELIHASLLSLLEICAPFTFEDFPAIYRDLLTSVPASLKALTSYGIHSYAMGSFGGILNAVKKSVGATPQVIYCENTYYECIKTAKKVSRASSIEEASETDLRETDLLLAQFNPVWQIDAKTSRYKTEKIADVIDRCLNNRQAKPLTIALDCTLDFINSPRIGKLLQQFQKEILDGRLNIICYRSGCKFDLFGMDNYCGAPFFMMHNRDAKWAAFDHLPNDPILQTDRLSLNWFCLAYQNAAPQLELYRKQIFDNTRALLNKVPPRLLQGKHPYRITPMDTDTDPAFIDIKISGPLHEMRGSALVAGSLYAGCFENGHPIFTRLSLGFSHPNFHVTFEKDVTSIRLTLGLDPAEVDLLANCFETIDALNGPSTPMRQQSLPAF